MMIHNNRLANPLNPYVREMKKLTAKRNKTDADVIEISRLEWEGGLYMHDGKVAIPAKCLNACFLRGATKRKNGPKWREGCYIDNDHHVLKYKRPMINVTENGEIPNPELDKYFDALANQDMVRVGQQTILRTRPIFTDWSLECAVLYDEALVDLRTLLQMCEDAGYRVGLCERRPEKGGSFGRFTVEAV